MSAKPFVISSLNQNSFLHPFHHHFDPLGYSKGKSHFQLAFLFVPSRTRRQLLEEFYAFCRLADDIADEPGPPQIKREALGQMSSWVMRRESIGHPFWDKFLAKLILFDVPFDCLAGVLNGVSIDLRAEDSLRFESWRDLEHYIQGVAVDVGRGVLHILGAKDPSLDDYALHMGRCVQLINFCRDIEEDLKNDRFYFPTEAMGGLRIDEHQKIRDQLFDRALQEWKLTKTYSWLCLSAELMVRIYLEGAIRYWQFGKNHRLSKSEKVFFALKHSGFFILERLRLKQPWMK